VFVFLIYNREHFVLSLDNDIEVNPVELLNKYRSQGVCVELCDELLIQVK